MYARSRIIRTADDGSAEIEVINAFKPEVLYFITGFIAVCLMGLSWFCPEIMSMIFSFVIIKPVYFIHYMVESILFPLVKFTATNLIQLLIYVISSSIIAGAILFYKALDTVPEESSFKPFCAKIFQISEIEITNNLSNSNSNSNSNTICLEQNFWTKALNKIRSSNLINQIFGNNLTINFVSVGFARIAHCINHSTSTRYFVLGIFNTWIPLPI